MNPAFGTSNNEWPCEGPKVIPVALSLSTSDYSVVDFTSEIERQQISNVQGLFVDNADNPERLIIVAETTGQRIAIPAYSQGYIQTLNSSTPRFSVKLETTPPLPVAVALCALNFPVSNCVWTATPP
jgi:hypothetical protein